MIDDDALALRVQAVLRDATAGLSEEDRAERTAWCRETGEHGVRMHLSDDDDVLEFRWGGRPLAMIRRGDLLGDEPVRAEFVATVPDTLPGDL